MKSRPEEEKHNIRQLHKPKIDKDHGQQARNIGTRKRG